MTDHARPLTIGLVVGEASGDTLAAGLVRVLRERYPGKIKVIGVVGPKLQKEGAELLYSMDHLSVMGLVEPLSRLPTLITIRRRLKKYFIENPPDVFIGVDSPDFNLGLEVALRKAGIPVVHYVSPTVWAWRKGRIHKISRAVDRMLTLFPFESEFYKRHKVPVTFVGHPLADEIEEDQSMASVRVQLGIQEKAKVVAILPGSRGNEIKQMTAVFIKTAIHCAHAVPDVQFIIPLVNEAHVILVKEKVRQLAPTLKINIVLGKAHDAVLASDAVLVTSGTATLETMLLQKPMVVAYRMAKLSYLIAGLLVKVPFIALPNLLAEKELVPEFIQEKANPENLSQAIVEFLSNENKRNALDKEYKRIHQMLACNANLQSANAVLDVIDHAK
jgi:lipid-A-disaccharide synthase